MNIPLSERIITLIPTHLINPTNPVIRGPYFLIKNSSTKKNSMLNTISNK